jgi:hypothetical protein
MWVLIRPPGCDRVRSGDLLSRGARRQHGAHGRRVRGIQKLFGVSKILAIYQHEHLLRDARSQQNAIVCQSEQISSFDSFMMLLTEEVWRTRFL